MHQTIANDSREKFGNVPRNFKGKREIVKINEFA